MGNQIDCKDVFVNFCLPSQLPSPAINIDASVNAAFTIDKLNAAKSYVDMHTINMTKHSTLI